MSFQAIVKSKHNFTKENQWRKRRRRSEKKIVKMWTNWRNSERTISVMKTRRTSEKRLKSTLKKSHGNVKMWKYLCNSIWWKRSRVKTKKNPLVLMSETRPVHHISHRGRKSNCQAIKMFAHEVEHNLPKSKWNRFGKTEQEISASPSIDKKAWWCAGNETHRQHNKHT